MCFGSSIGIGGQGCGLEKIIICHPVRHALWPAFDRSKFGALAQVEAMTATGVKVDFHRTLDLLILLQLRQHWADVTPVIVRDEEKCGWGIGRNFSRRNTQRAGVN